MQSIHVDRSFVYFQIFLFSRPKKAQKYKTANFIERVDSCTGSRTNHVKLGDASKESSAWRVQIMTEQTIKSCGFIATQS